MTFVNDFSIILHFEESLLLRCLHCLAVLPDLWLSGVQETHFPPGTLEKCRTMRFVGLLGCSGGEDGARSSADHISTQSGDKTHVCAVHGGGGQGPLCVVSAWAEVLAEDGRAEMLLEMWKP